MVTIVTPLMKTPIHKHDLERRQKRAMHSQSDIKTEPALYQRGKLGDHIVAGHKNCTVAQQRPDDGRCFVVPPIGGVEQRVQTARVGMDDLRFVSRHGLTRCPPG